MLNDDLFSITSKYINNTNRHVFLTGRAGTGKTTFLKKVFHSTHKKCVIAAPTGVAAINAGGVTLHSLLQLPFGCFVPAEILSDIQEIAIKISTPATILKEMRFSRIKLSLLRELELLIIDEVSMLRADLLDAIDTILRLVRRNQEPFGGLQIFFVGDLLQLPPVVKDQEWWIISKWYKSPYFFEAKVLKENPPVYIELKKIFRQSDQAFIEILNNFRYNRPSQRDLDMLNKTCQKFDEVKNCKDYIFITTHNRIVDERNNSELKKLESPTSYFEAEVEGDFPEYLFPVEFELQLKVGARVMFIKNDYSGKQLYFNGKLATVIYLERGLIEVEFDDNTENVLVEKYTWENKSYSLNETTGEIIENVEGTFSQYPIRLAWAVTVHKSQGLTFEKAILDLSGAFAPGQIYVALSRLRSVEGLVLSSPLNFNKLRTDQVILDYTERKKDKVSLLENLKDDTFKFAIDQTLNAFDFSSLHRSVRYHLYSYDKIENTSIKKRYWQWAFDLAESFRVIKDVADKFIKQLNFLAYYSKSQGMQPLFERVKAAKEYFEPILKSYSTKVINQKLKVSAEAKKVKTYLNELSDLDMQFLQQIYKIKKAEAVICTTLEDVELLRMNFDASEIYKERNKLVMQTDEVDKKQKFKKKNAGVKLKSNEISYQMFSKGMSINEIVKERGLAVSTIEGHLLHFVRQGKIDINQLIESDKLDKILEIISKCNNPTSKEIKEKLSDKFSYSEIRFVLASIETNRIEPNALD
ncbi:MAG TPA: helix-turn-helix domain-containing protein [Bacteroidales bacterium]|nr:helix-turn-helix domain-containing protein [Bacteroidales bacterium]HQF01540.1 helix-turn-helix domain-containing protein [Bacteroidales bacterium]HQO07259.1 helix-turn-helix domain-containing protein [Bacteroidales bacterium]HQP54309.1 helix-turn-helix domain-containing protein [Bacteroidales bacterium]